MRGQIVKISSNMHTVMSEDKLYNCLPRGIFRRQQILPRVGDFVLFDKDKLVIDEILPRKNEFKRPLVSNIDQAIIVTSLKEPAFSLGLLDRFLALMEINNVEAIICVTKEDLLTKEEKEKCNKILDYYKSIGYKLVANTDIEAINKILKNKTSVFTGQTGAGKSTLLNKLNTSWDLKTGEISKALGRGKHTTRNVELYPYLGGCVLDTPGFSSLEFQDYTKEEIRKAYLEFNDYPCKYKDCAHINESECSVKKAVRDGLIIKSRYQNYLSEVKEGK